TPLGVPGSTILAGSAHSADLRAIVEAAKIDSDSEKEPILSGLATAPGLAGALMPVQKRFWFPLLHLLPASALMALWAWEQRRRFVEQHPDVVLRRRALRALRRERKRLDRAARARDSATFASGVINAMQVAVAPFFPAEPRALVGADVLMMLAEGEQTGTAAQTVRRVFSRADAARFGMGGATASELLELKPEIEIVLDQLETRLCR
ncbi:MAG TPA: hypothetical protein VL793_06790, partial [Patescibacteria group bacterium]|nr:hypothetical protein [Patescibacteria group bacterium]